MTSKPAAFQPFDLTPVFPFLRDLSRHNDRAWFEQNRPAYEAARGQFERFVAALIDAIDAFDPLEGVQAKDCLFRIHRDVRFSRDKSPYQTHFGASIAPGGRKAQRMGYYIHLEPGDRSLVAGGLYAPEADQLARFRADIAQDARDFRAILAAPAFVQAFGAVQGDQLKTAPQGYDRAHPDIDLLRLKQVIVVRNFSDGAVLAPGFAVEVSESCRAMQPFLTYLDSVIR